MFLLHELQQFALAQQRVGEVQPVELDLLRGKDAEVVDEPAIERLVVGKLEAAHRMRHVLNRIRLPVRVVIHRIDAPFVARAMMRRVQDAIHHRIAHVQVRRRHVDLGPQHAAAIGELALLHPNKQVKILFNGPVAIRAVLARLGQCAAVLADLIGSEVIDVCLAGPDQLQRPLVELPEIVRGKAQALPVEPQPANVLLNRIDIFLLFLLGIRVVKAQIRFAAELVSKSEVNADRLGVADVKIAIRLGWKPGLNDGIAVLLRAHIFCDLIAEKVGGSADFLAFRTRRAHGSI